MDETKTYVDYIAELESVPPYKRFYFGQQELPWASSALRPPMAKMVWMPAASVIDRLRKFEFQNFSVHGRELLPSPFSQPLIFVSNHVSYMDPPVIGFTIAKAYGALPWFMAKKRLWDQWSYRWSFPVLGALPFTRRSTDLDEHIKHLRGFVSILKANEPLVVYPEGTIPGEIELSKLSLCRLRSEVESATGLLKGSSLVPFLAYVSGAKVVPVGISGSGMILPPEVNPGGIDKPQRKKDHPVVIRFGEPIDVRSEMVEKFGKTFSETNLADYANARMMPAISNLIDFSLHKLPVKLPLSDEDYKRLREFEMETALHYWAKGKNEHGEKILERLGATPLMQEKKSAKA